MHYGYDPTIGWVKISGTDYQWHLMDAAMYPAIYEGWRFLKIGD